jgi:hypothetical protein
VASTTGSGMSGSRSPAGGMGGSRSPSSIDR